MHVCVCTCRCMDVCVHVCVCAWVYVCSVVDAHLARALCKKPTIPVSSVRLRVGGAGTTTGRPYALEEKSAHINLLLTLRYSRTREVSLVPKLQNNIRAITTSIVVTDSLGTLA